MVTEVRISDPHVISLIEAEQERTGEATATKTAGRLIAERIALKEMTEATKMASQAERPLTAAAKVA